jgi:hypothetical protein
MKIGAFEIDEPLPMLHDPHVITILRPWLDAGSVGTLSLTALEEYFRAQPLGHLAQPGAFFDFTRYRPTVHFVDDERVYTVPNVQTNYVIRPEAPDLLFVHLMEPHNNAEVYIEAVIELFKELKVQRVCRLGGMWDAVPHTRPLPVNRTVQGRNQRPPRNRRYEGPTSIMNMLFETLDKAGVETVSFMVRLPYYAQLEEDYAGTARLLEALSETYPLPPDLIDASRLRQQQHDMEAELARNPGANSLVRRLEAEYDNNQLDAPQSPSSSTPLSPELEKFLRELGDQLPNS